MLIKKIDYTGARAGMVLKHLFLSNSICGYLKILELSEFTSLGGSGRYFTRKIPAEEKVAHPEIESDSKYETEFFFNVKYFFRCFYI